METISPTLFFTKYVFLHECVAIMPSPSFVVSVIFSTMLEQFNSYLVIVVDALQSITITDLSLL